MPFFSSIVKNVASPNFEIKKLVYIYLLHYAESEPDLALLSINTIQKSLSDQSPQVRAMALRVMSGIRVPVISQIVSLAIKKGSVDMSPFVRKAAALAIPKCYRLDPNTLPQLLDYLSPLLGDKQYFVAGVAVTAFLEVCPDRMDLIHKHYRGLVRKLVDMDEWGQLATLKLLTYYCRKCFPRKTGHITTQTAGSSYRNETSEEKAKYSEAEVHKLDPDMELFLKACKNILQSRNSAVIVSVARCFFYLGTPEYVAYAAGPMVALLRSSSDIQQVALVNIVVFCLKWPNLYVRYASHFLVKGTDSTVLASFKFEILTLIFPHCDAFMKEMILGELRHFTRASNTELVRAAVQAIGRCAQHDPKESTRCMQLLFKQMSSQDGNLVAESVTVIRHLIQQAPQSHIKTVIWLAKSLDAITNPEARASIIWLIGEFAGIGGENNIAPDVLRILVKTFVDESEAAKLQIILLAAKVYLHHLLRHPPKPPSPEPVVSSPNTAFSFSLPPEDGFQSFSPSPPSREAQEAARQPDPEHPILKLWNYILLLAHYDTSYDLRDRTRTYKALLANPSTTQLASLMLLAPKPVPRTPSPSESRVSLLLGSSSLVFGMPVMGYEPLPEWVKEGEEPDKRYRDEGKDTEDGEVRNTIPATDRLGGTTKGMNPPTGPLARGGISTAEGKQSTNEKSLDDWLAEDDDEEEDEGEEEEEEDDDDDDDDESEVDESEVDEGSQEAGSGSEEEEAGSEETASDQAYLEGKPETQPLVGSSGTR